MFKYDVEAVTNELIKKEMLEEVSSSRIFIRSGQPDPLGMVSYEIFGQPGTPERKETFAYISLNDWFVHPHIMNELKSIRRDFLKLVMGENEYYLSSGTIVKVDEDKELPKEIVTGTGVRFLMKIWDKLDFNYKNVKSGMRQDRLKFLFHLKKNEVFINKLIVIPPYYRDVDNTGGKKNEINDFYGRIMNLASTIKSTGEFMGVLDEVSDAHRNIIITLKDHYDKMLGMFGGTKGFIHKHVMGKAIDFSSRLVISGATFTGDSPDDSIVKFDRTAVPLFSVIKCFAPFIVYGVKKIVENFLAGSTVIWFIDDKGNVSRKQLADHWGEILTPAYIYKLIELFDESLDHRLDPFEIECEDGQKVPLMYITDDELISAQNSEMLMKSVKKVIQPVTLLHLFYMAAYNEVKDKHIYVTRYPIEDQNNMYPSRMTINSYINTDKRVINDIEYPNFPIVDTKKDKANIESMFVDTLVLFPTYLSALGGDFDGDQVSIQGVFSEEANKDAYDHIFNKSNIINIIGSTMRNFGEVAEHIIFNLTRNPNKP